ncbi:signal peptidase I [Streptomyces sp. NPDC060194]|uniref:signal peptidase I n=1 Tax=Streptomyces sp. NPDC060194 TaxID=3347069 RepID=UPI003652AF00
MLVPLGVVLLASGIRFGSGLASEWVTVSSDSMEPTYPAGDRLAVERVDGSGIRRGDVLLIDVPGRYGGLPTLQRVVGLGGDRVESRDGVRVVVNGKQIDEPYVKRDKFTSTTSPYAVTVPEGRLFLLGDHRANANDSRYFLDEQSGSVAASDVRGRVRETPASSAVMSVVGILGALLTLAGTGLALAGYMAGRRARDQGAAQQPRIRRRP